MSYCYHVVSYGDIYQFSRVYHSDTGDIVPGDLVEVRMGSDIVDTAKVAEIMPFDDHAVNEDTYELRKLTAEEASEFKKDLIETFVRPYVEGSSDHAKLLFYALVEDNDLMEEMLISDGVTLSDQGLDAFCADEDGVLREAFLNAMKYAQDNKQLQILTRIDDHLKTLGKAIRVDDRLLSHCMKNGGRAFTFLMEHGTKAVESAENVARSLIDREQPSLLNVMIREDLLNASDTDRLIEYASSRKCAEAVIILLDHKKTMKEKAAADPAETAAAPFDTWEL